MPLNTPILAVACGLWLMAASVVASDAADETGPFQATGFKVGEIDATSAIVWTRLTLRPQRNPSDGPDVKIDYEKTNKSVPRRDRTVKAIRFDDGVTVRDMRMAAPGADGEVRVLYQPDGDSQWRETPWEQVDPLGDLTRQFHLRDLQPATRYLLRVESRTRQGQSGQTLEGECRTAPAADDAARVVFTVSTGQGNLDNDRPDGFNIYPEMRKLSPDFFVHTGDILYYDDFAKTVDLARYHWQRTYSWPTNVEFHRHVGSYFIKDDHDTWRDDCWPSMKTPYMHEFTFPQGVALFLEQVPMGDRTYRTRRWGKDLQIWLVEGRDFRSRNDAPDGPD